jgi:hypothetical protein
MSGGIDVIFKSRVAQEQCRHVRALSGSGGAGISGTKKS